MQNYSIIQLLLLHGSLFASHITTCEEHFLQPSVSCCVRMKPRLLATSPTMFWASPVLCLELSPSFPRLAFFLGSSQMKPLLRQGLLASSPSGHSSQFVLCVWSAHLEPGTGKDCSTNVAQVRTDSQETLVSEPTVSGPCLPHQICFLS